MQTWVRVAVAGGAALAVQACGRGSGDATAAAHALLAAAQTGDVKAFEAELDRPAIRQDLKAQIAAVGKARGLDLGGPSDRALDVMIDPSKLRLVQAGSGAPLTAPPSQAQVDQIVRRVDGKRACVHDLSPQKLCVLTLAKEPAGWRVIGMLAANLTIAIPPEPAKK